MKNPFQGKVTAKLARTKTQWRLVWNEPVFGISNSFMNEEQAKYAAEAINQHDKLVEMLRRIAKAFNKRAENLRQTAKSAKNFPHYAAECNAEADSFNQEARKIATLLDEEKTT